MMTRSKAKKYLMSYGVPPDALGRGLFLIALSQSEPNPEQWAGLDVATANLIRHRLEQSGIDPVEEGPAWGNMATFTVIMMVADGLVVRENDEYRLSDEQ